MGDLLDMVYAFICGAGGLALINIVQKRWEMRYQRKAEKEDRAEEKDDKIGAMSKQLTDFIEAQHEFNSKSNERFSEMERSDAAQSEALKYVLLDRILYIGQSYIKHGEVSYDDRKRLREMHDVYHSRLDGNGDAKKIMEAVDELPLTTQK